MQNVIVGILPTHQFTDTFKTTHHHHYHAASIARTCGAYMWLQCVRKVNVCLSFGMHCLPTWRTSHYHPHTSTHTDTHPKHLSMSKIKYAKKRVTHMTSYSKFGAWLRDGQLKCIYIVKGNPIVLLKEQHLVLCWWSPSKSLCECLPKTREQFHTKHGTWREKVLGLEREYIVSELDLRVKRIFEVVIIWPSLLILNRLVICELWCEQIRWLVQVVVRM